MCRRHFYHSGVNKTSESMEMFCVGWVKIHLLFTKQNKSSVYRFRYRTFKHKFTEMIIYFHKDDYQCSLLQPLFAGFVNPLYSISLGLSLCATTFHLNKITGQKAPLTFLADLFAICFNFSRSDFSLQKGM